MNFGFRYFSPSGQPYDEATLSAAPWSTLIAESSSDFSPPVDTRISATQIKSLSGGSIDTVYGYVSLGKAQVGREFFNSIAASDKSDLADPNDGTIYDQYVIDFWKTAVRDVLSAEIVKQQTLGFDGVFLDDTDQYFARQGEINADIDNVFADDDIRNAGLALLDAVVELKADNPTQKFIVNVDPYLLNNIRFGLNQPYTAQHDPEIAAFAAAIDGVLVENYSVNAATVPGYHSNLLAGFQAEGILVQTSEIFDASAQRSDVIDYYVDAASRGYMPTATRVAFNNFDPTIPTFNAATPLEDVLALYEAGTLSGLAGDDHLFGSDGDDVMIGGDGADALEGGAGIDRAQYSDTASGVTADIFNSAANTGYAAGDTYTSIENLRGGSGDDDLRGNGGANRLEGMEGDDVLSGRAGDDVLIGAAGNDTFNGGTGGDAIFGGAGSDTANYSSAATADLQFSALNAGTQADGDAYDSIENLRGSVENDSLRGDGTANTLRGSHGNDVLSGRGGNDTLYGDLGNDVLMGGSGADLFHGGSGTDRADYLDASGGVMADLQIAARNSGIAAGDSYVSIENLRGSQSADDLRGDTGDNVVSGMDGDDILFGRNGDDVLRGRAGDDRLGGGNGNDILTGGIGADAFVFNRPSEGVDTIRDFQLGSDSIWLKQSGFSSLGAGALDAEHFRLGSAALDADDFVLFDAGALYYDADANGTGAAVQIAALGNGAAIDASDFFIF